MTDYELATAILASLGAFLFVFVIIAIAVYVLYGMSHMKALKLMGYQNAWAAWIPFYGTYALADCIPETKENVNIFGLSIPGTVFKFWWVLLFILPFVPVVGNILVLALQIMCLGKCYTSIYANIEGVSEDNVKVIGYLSGWINLIAVVKFFTYKK